MKALAGVSFMRALVLSGGGSKGAYQVGVLKYLLGFEGRQYDIICGTSVGAINGATLSMYKEGDEARSIQDLEKFWLSISTRSIYKRWALGYLSVLWRSSVYNSKPLQKLIRSNLCAEAIRASGKQLSVGAVSLKTGEYRTWNEKDPEIVEAVMASGAFPGVLLPVEIGGELWIDGGVRENTPLGKAIELGATEIDVILTFPRNPEGKLRSTKTLGVVRRTIDSLTSELFWDDLKMAALYNELVACSEGVGFKDKRHVPIRVWQPEGVLIDNPLDFDPGVIRDNISLGFQDALENRLGQDLTSILQT